MASEKHLVLWSIVLNTQHGYFYACRPGLECCHGNPVSFRGTLEFDLICNTFPVWQRRASTGCVRAYVRECVRVLASETFFSHILIDLSNYSLTVFAGLTGCCSDQISINSSCNYIVFSSTRNLSSWAVPAWRERFFSLWFPLILI